MNAQHIHQHISDNLVVGGGAGISTGATLFGMAMRDVNEYLQGISFVVGISVGALTGIYTLVKLYEYFNKKRKARRR